MRVRLDEPHGLDKRQARRLRRRIAANLRVPEAAAIDCAVGGCRWGSPGRGRCKCVPPTPRDRTPALDPMDAYRDRSTSWTPLDTQETR